MNEKIPDLVDPRVQAQKKAHYSGCISIKQLPRLEQSVVGLEGDVMLTLSFDFDESRMVVVRCQIEATICLNCQRCLEPYSYVVNKDISYSPVTDQQDGDALPKSYEPLQIDDDGMFSLLGLVEEELILSLPIIPRHSEEACSVKFDFSGQEEAGQERTKPFGGLAKQIRQKVQQKQGET